MAFPPPAQHCREKVFFPGSCNYFWASKHYFKSVCTTEELGHKVLCLLWTCWVLEVPHDVRLLFPDCMSLLQLQLSFCDQHINYSNISNVLVSSEKFFQLFARTNAGVQGNARGWGEGHMAVSVLVSLSFVALPILQSRRKTLFYFFIFSLYPSGCSCVV